jgi:hypothetical protein
MEAIAWWNPGQLVGNLAVRAELREDIDVVMAALGCPGTRVLRGGGSGCPCSTQPVAKAGNQDLPEGRKWPGYTGVPWPSRHVSPGIHPRCMYALISVGWGSRATRQGYPETFGSIPASDITR